MNVGYGHLLSHIPTKFRARRSDIIVSSTLSITLTPSDGDYKCKDLALMSSHELSQWCDKRSEFRAQLIYNNYFEDVAETINKGSKLGNLSPFGQRSVGYKSDDDKLS
jgi:hypothetical protein